MTERAKAKHGRQSSKRLKAVLCVWRWRDVKVFMKQNERWMIVTFCGERETMAGELILYSENFEVRNIYANGIE